MPVIIAITAVIPMGKIEPPVGGIVGLGTNIVGVGDGVGV